MSTRSIVIDRVNGLYIYIHFDGHPSHVGKLLQEFYSYQDEVDILIGLGDLESLGVSPASPPKGCSGVSKVLGLNTYTTAYHRDHGEPWDVVKPRVFDKYELKDLKKGVSFVYQWNGNHWTVLDCSRKVKYESLGVRL